MIKQTIQDGMILTQDGFFLEVCEMCEQQAATHTVSVQTIPGSLDTKTHDMRMCASCTAEYDEFLVDVWQDYRPNMDALINQHGEYAE